MSEYTRNLEAAVQYLRDVVDQVNQSDMLNGYMDGYLAEANRLLDRVDKEPLAPVGTGEYQYEAYKFQVQYSSHRGEVYVQDQSGTQVFTLEEGDVGAVVLQKGGVHLLNWVYTNYYSELEDLGLV